MQDVHKTSEQKTFELGAPDERCLLVSEGQAIEVLFVIVLSVEDH